MDVANFNQKQMNTLRKVFHALNHFMVFMWKIGWGKLINFWPAVIGRIMVIKHRGRKSGKEYLTPVNYAIVDGGLYCMAGFGSNSDWYKNIMANPKIELWLPEGKGKSWAEDVSDSPNRLFILRQVIVASGFAGPLFGINPKKLSDAQLDEVSKEYRLVHFLIGKYSRQSQIPKSSTEPSIKTGQSKKKNRKYYVYAHRDENGKIFYIGKGSGKRAWSKDRHEVWQRYVNEWLHGNYSVDIIQENMSEEAAEDLEDDLLNQHGKQLVNWINPGRQFNHETLQEYHSRKSENRKFFDETIPLEGTDPEEAIKRYRIILSRMREYESLVLEYGLIPTVAPDLKFGEPRMLERLIICLIKLGRNKEAITESEEYFHNFPDAVILSAGQRVIKRISKIKQ